MSSFSLSLPFSSRVSLFSFLCGLSCDFSAFHVKKTTTTNRLKMYDTDIAFPCTGVFHFNAFMCFTSSFYMHDSCNVYNIYYAYVIFYLTGNV